MHALDVPLKAFHELFGRPAAPTRKLWQGAADTLACAFSVLRCWIWARVRPFSALGPLAGVQLAAAFIGRRVIHRP